MTASPWPESIRAISKYRLIYSRQYLAHHQLDYFVLKITDPERPEGSLASLFGNSHFSNRPRPVGHLLHPGYQPSYVSSQLSTIFLLCLTIYSNRLSTILLVEAAGERLLIKVWHEPVELSLRVFTRPLRYPFQFRCRCIFRLCLSCQRFPSKDDFYLGSFPPRSLLAS